MTVATAEETTGNTGYDVETIRRDFPILSRRFTASRWSIWITVLPPRNPSR